MTSARFLAAAAVYLYHCRGFLATKGSVFYNTLLSGRHAVYFFFVLSGFVLAHSHWKELQTGHISTRKFYWARVARVYPMYLVSMVLTLPVFLFDLRNVGQHLGAKGWIEAAALVPFDLQHLVPGPLLNWNYPTWSLLVEATFYLLFPVLAIRLLSASPRKLWSFVVGIWVAGTAVSVLSVWLMTNAHASEGWMTVRGRFPLFCLAVPLMGIPVYQLYLRSIRRTAWYWPVMWLVLFVGACALGMVSIEGNPVVSEIGYQASALFCVPLLLSLATWTPSPKNWMVGKAAVLLGGASYSFYLLHIAAITLIGAVVGRFHTGLAATIGLMLAGFFLTCLASILCFEKIEQPCRERIRRWATRTA